VDSVGNQTGSPKFNIQHRAFVTSAVRSAVGFLEAAINEVFSDVADGHDSYVAPLSDQCRQSMGSRWNRKTQRLKSRRDNKRPEILEKYQVALACSGNPVFEKDTQPYVDAELLISLRNRLETRAPSDEDEFADKLKGKFKLNPLTTNAYFPDSYLSAGCACWAFKTATALADEVFSRMKLTPNYQRPDSFPAP
jgi:hypothetical protein